MKRLIDVVIENFALDHRGIHGVSHWARVMLNGEMLHRHHPEIDLHVVKLFGVLHDCKRVCDSGDHDHGIRAADWLVTQNNILFKTTPIQLSHLVRACRGHTLEKFTDDITVQACWDSDRLDIGRCKEIVDTSFLGTPAAKLDEVVAHAIARSRKYL